MPVRWSERDSFGHPVLMRLGKGASASISSMAQAMGIAVVPPEIAMVAPGQALAVESLAE
ncbi:hypothetical protein GCM10011316_14710 [Roseibium aquae]|uniref:MoeA C-terminal domain-containing protein n=1 Tax=Roseibium aquae TaxID=1323746 RepID=A0A916THW4_9HYPH|nr:hypothetical protein [Roseibium aquae]GGB43809.1 hypothetical protein GCM10011316_14710 [Roseibium aquae]